MSGMPKRRHPLSTLSNTTRQALKRSATAMGKQKFLPKALRKQLNRLGQARRPSPPNNRRKKITPELQEYIKGLQNKETSKKIIRDFRELAHYAYVFDIEYYKSQLDAREAETLQNIGDVILHYCSSGSQEGIDPSNLFDTENYFSKYPDVKESGLNPMIHCFKFGMNEHRYSMDNIHFMRKMADIRRPEPNLLNSIKDDLKTKKIGVFLHIFYPELGETIAAYLKNIPCNIDIFISTKEDSVQALKNIFARVENADRVDVRHFSNIGRDVAPFIVGFKDQILNYDLILKLHSKKSPHSNALSGWFLHCLDNLIGSETITATNLKELQSQEIGIVYPIENYALSLGIKHDSCWGHEDGNYTKASPFLKRFNLDHIKRDSQFRFPTGTMFWCKPELLKPILDWNLSWNDFDEEGGQIDGTIAHSIERLIGLSTTEIFNQKLQTTYCGYALSKQHQTDKSIIEGKNKLKIQGFEKVIHFKPQQLDPDWSLKRNINPKSLHIHWVIPNFTPGLGGHMTIFRAIDYLERCGHQCTIWVHSELKGNDKPSRISSLHKRVIDQSFIPLQTDQVYMLGNNQDDLDLVSGDIVIATDRMSSYPVLGMKKFQKRFYFVQDYEPYFFARGSSSILTEHSYASKNNFSCICASPWLKQKMESFGNSAISFPLAVDHSVYQPNNDQKRNKHAIAFYVRRSTPRRLYELGLLALRALFDLGEHFEIITFGEKDLPDLGIPVKVRHAGILDADALANLYRQCAVGFVLSGTNYSLVPNEMMACGLPVVDIDAEHTRVSYQPNTAVLAEATPVGLASALSRLLNDASFREITARAGLAATEQLTWDGSNKVIETFIQASLPSAPSTPHPVQTTTPLVTVVIPVYNGGTMLKAVVESCLTQDLDQAFEVLLIDSASSDGCLEGLPEDERLRLHRIRKEDFGHGRTRNLGVELARGEYVAFITQDAIPANRMWLMNLIAPLQNDPRVAGVFGCHIAHTNHGQLTAHDLDQHFNRWIFRSHRQPIELNADRQTTNGVVSSHERFYSDNNSCLRKSAWETLPLPDVVYGEDQLWAREILRKGYKKAYASTAVVRHSHEYGFRETVLRANTEWHFYNRMLGERLPSSKQQVLQMVERSCNNDVQAQKLYPDISDQDLIRRRKLHFARACGYYLAGKGHGGIRP
ncbi:rhamnan synthesis F family protein [Synechococcus sp. YX-04-1]|uniref:rhamnosyltransferase WsaF family glycosyltransferase n=1 Tax=Synechococcus sp. YX-04-1 TaxID=3062778 RepID=UPI0026E42009|nr:rhamnan synthesis F family protein [Synechococcus sp. YX-04-1]MDO6352487.1 rhamnan synthesis F family protein [Synechococcus sp. YX-04-1]